MRVGPGATQPCAHANAIPGLAATIATAAIQQRRRDRFGHHVELQHDYSTCARLFRTGGTDRNLPDYGFDATAVGLAGVAVAQLTKRTLLPSISVSGQVRSATHRPHTSSRHGLICQPNIVMVRGRQTSRPGSTTGSRLHPVSAGATRIAKFRSRLHAVDYSDAGCAERQRGASLRWVRRIGIAGFTANPFFQWIYTAPGQTISAHAPLSLNPDSMDVTSPVTERFNRLDRAFFAGQVNPISSKIDQTKFPAYKVSAHGFAGRMDCRARRSKRLE